MLGSSGLVELDIRISLLYVVQMDITGSYINMLTWISLVFMEVIISLYEPIVYLYDNGL